MKISEEQTYQLFKLFKSHQKEKESKHQGKLCHGCRRRHGFEDDTDVHSSDQTTWDTTPIYYSQKQTMDQGNTVM